MGIPLFNASCVASKINALNRVPALAATLER